MKRPLVIAHRGFSARYIENTLTAYRAAVAAGADIVESDARLSKDGQVWSCHDATLQRLIGDPRAIADLTSSDLSAVKLPGGERLTTLRQAVRQIAHERPVLIDIKTDDLDLIDAVVREVRSLKAVKQVWIGARSAAQIQRAKAMEPDLSLLAFLPDYAIVREFEEAGARAFRVWERDLVDEAAAPLVESHRTIWVTTGGRGTPFLVGDSSPDSIRRILYRRPSGILLNDPMLLIQNCSGLGPTSAAPMDLAGGAST